MIAVPVSKQQASQLGSCEEQEKHVLRLNLVDALCKVHTQAVTAIAFRVAAHFDITVMSSLEPCMVSSSCVASPRICPGMVVLLRQIRGYMALPEVNG